MTRSSAAADASEAGASSSGAPTFRAPTFRAAVFAGLDEAGYGPLLGPLTYGYAAFRSERGRAPHWDDLSSAASEKDAPDRVVVADSKVVFDRTPRGSLRLEHTVLAFLGNRDEPRPASGRELWETAPPGLAPGASDLAEHPWYEHLAARLPVHATCADVDGHVSRVGAALRSAGLAIAAAGTRVVPVAALNRALARSENKGATHWHFGGAIVESLFARYGALGLDLTCDRLGGRVRYEPLLTDLLPWSEVRTLRQESEWSEYDVLSGERRMRIRFVEKGDRISFTVALASCIAKYARELEMAAFNAYFAGLDPALSPTAGYFGDGRRWLADAAAAVARSGIAEACLVRIR